MLLRSRIAAQVPSTTNAYNALSGDGKMPRVALDAIAAIAGIFIAIVEVNASKNEVLSNVEV